MDPYDDARNALRALIESAQDNTNLNEATTRLRLIDTLLFSCLGWSTADVNAEQYAKPGFVDYAVGRPATEFILEAKREGTTFELPVGLDNQRSVQLATLSEHADTKDAIEQVLAYCQRLGVPLAAISNGRQIVAFLASRQDGVPPREGAALCFNSLEAMNRDFNVLWSHLSKEGVRARNLQATLLSQTRRRLPPAKLASEITYYPGFRARSHLETDVKLLSGIFLQDLEQEESISTEFLRDCYCSSGALTQYAFVSREILTSKYVAVQTVTGDKPEPAVTKKGVNPKLASDMVAAAMSKRPLVLLGDVGVGKSMFLRHLIRVDANDILADSLVFYIDFGSEPALESDLQNYVYRRTAETLLSTYGIDVLDANLVRAVYNAEINRFRRSGWGELRNTQPQLYLEKEIQYLDGLVSASAAHLRRVLDHLRATAGRASVIVLDNIDQRSADFQDQVFLIGQSFAQTWPSTVFVSLRPSTFFESRDSRSLSGYHTRVFTVSPARVDQVVERRIAFAQKEVSRADQEQGVFGNLSISASDLSAYLDALSVAFRDNDDLRELLDNLSGGNLRLALTFLGSFVGSGYVSTARILRAAADGGVYTIPVHEFLRSTIYGDYDYFSPNQSQICNLFDIVESDGREHFLLPLLLAHILRVGENAGSRGFVEPPEVYQYGLSIGFSQEQVSAHLARALRTRLIEGQPGKMLSGPVRITSVGSYMIRSMVSRFVYVDAMIIDTPIVDISTRKLVHDVRSLNDRVERVELFKRYLDDQWAAIPELVSESSFNWPRASVLLEKDLASVRAGAERAARRDY